MNKNRVTELFGIKYPIIQGGMVWMSGWRLASAVSNAGGLGLLGCGSMTPEVLEEHIIKMKEATNKPWGLNLPLMYPQMEALIELVLKHEIKIVFTSAGSPKKYTSLFHEHGIKVAHVVASSAFAKKCEEAGVDAVVCEGFEAGGHNGKEETTTLTLIPQVCKATSLPVIAAGGIASGQAIFAAQSLGAEGVQMGTLFALTKESGGADNFKELCISLKEGDTMLAIKTLSPTRLIKNKLFNALDSAEKAGASADELKEILGLGATKRGMFEGDLDNGELEIGQIASDINNIISVEEAMNKIVKEYSDTVERMQNYKQL